jgi:tetratricopeptide (TPR) repeat protein
MNSLFTAGQEHLSKGNFFAARDLWQTALQHPHSEAERASLTNALGATMDRIFGSNIAKTYFERNLEFIENTDDFYTKLKCASNLVIVLAREERVDTALKIARHLAVEPSESPRQEVLYALSARCYALLRSELYDQVIDEVDRWSPVIQANRLVGLSRRHWHTVVHNSASALASIGQGDLALQRYRELMSSDPNPATAREVSRLLLFKGEVAESLRLSQDLEQDFWRFTITSEKVQIARAIELVGIFAYYAGVESLFERCNEKAEMYYGQSCQWAHWLRMRDLRRELGNYDIHISKAHFRWEEWHSVLDYLNLIDGLESMFPRLYQIARLATATAIRTMNQLQAGDAASSRVLGIAGRLAYIGLTVYTSSEEAAEVFIRDNGERQEVSNLGARLLDAYPQAAVIRDVVSQVWAEPDCGQNHKLLRTCLAIAYAYVESIMFEDKSHEQALGDLVANPPAGVSANALEAFHQLFQL